MKKAKAVRREPYLSLGSEDPPRSDAVEAVSLAAEPRIDAAPDVAAPFAGSASGEIHLGPLEPASPGSAIHEGPLEPSRSGEIHVGPLDHSPASDIQIGPLERAPGLGGGALDLDLPPQAPPAAIASVDDGSMATAVFETPLVAEVANAPSAKSVAIAKRRKSWREQRWERRRRRIYFEEALAWVLVPVILVACYLGAKGVLAAFGTTPTALIQGIQTALSSRS